MGAEVWEKVWTKKLITSDYSLKYLDFIQRIELELPEGSKVLEVWLRDRPNPFTPFNTA